MKKFKHKELVLLIAYLAVLLPSITGRFVCINPCNSEYETASMQDCCCHAPQAQLSSCCSHASSESTPAHTNICVIDQCFCIDIPLDTREPHYTVRTVNQAPLLLQTPTMLAAAVLNEDSGTLYKTTSPVPGDINNLHTVILLI